MKKKNLLNGKKVRRFPVMFSPEEFVVMNENARNAGMTPSAYIRFMTAGSKPDRKLPTEQEEARLKGIAAFQQISKNLEQLNGVSDDILIMVRTELMAVRQLIAKG